MSGPERPTLYNSSTPAPRASAAREQAPCSRLSGSGGLWGNSKTTCGNCGKGRNPPATIHVLDSSPISIISRRALRRPACAARRGGNRHDPVQKLYSRKVCIFSVSRLGVLQTPNIAIACGNCGNSPRGWRDGWRIGFMGLFISGDCRPATNVSATNVSGLAQMTSGNCANPSRKPPTPLRARHAVPRAGQTGRW